MVKKIFIFLLSFHVMINTSELTTLLSDTKVLKDPKKIQALLTPCGFTKVAFTTQDNVKISALFLDQSKQSKQPIKGTIIFAAGFYPGTKEGMATFYGMLQDQPYNFLFFDARRHNESEGSLWSFSYLKEYGKSEYFDILGAIKFIEQHNQQFNINQSIILHGLCSGAFHAVKATSTLQNKTPRLCNVKGIIFDSGWNCLTDVVTPLIYAESEKLFANSYFSILQKPLAYILDTVYAWTLKSSHQQLGSIEDTVATLSCPILFIHSTHDNYAPIQHVQALAQKTKCPSTWWDNSQSHATCHLKNQADYTTTMKMFLEKIT